MLLAGIAGTALMTMVASMAPMMGLPKMSPPDMIAAMIGIPAAAGWVMHFMIGTIFAAAFTFIFHAKVNSSSQKITLGLLFGFLAFIVGQVGMMMMGMIFSAPPMDDMLPMMVGSAIGHLVFGLTVSLVHGVYTEHHFEPALVS